MKKILFIGLLLFASESMAQIEHPRASPAATIEQKIGLTTIRISYSRPAARGRKIFGDLVPYNRIWRVGANESTKISLDTAIEVQGNLLESGTYALYAFPQETHWEIAFHTNTSHWGDGRKKYDPKEDAFRITISPEQIPYHQENFLISFDNLNHDGATLQLIWENTKLCIPIKVDTDLAMRNEIERQIKENPTAQTYYEAARYFQEQGIQNKRALAYLEKAIALQGDTYYFHRVKSLVEAAMDDYHSALASAKKSLTLAKALEKDEFVRMNQKNIKKWEALLKEQR